MVTLIGSHATTEEILARLSQIAKEIEAIEARQDFLAHRAEDGDLTIGQRRRLIEAGNAPNNLQDFELADFALFVDRDELTQLLDQEDSLIDELIQTAAEQFPDPRDLFYEALSYPAPATRTMVRFIEKSGQ